MSEVGLAKGEAGGCSDEEKSESYERCRAKVKWGSRKCSRKVAAVRPMPRKEGSGISEPRTASSPAGQLLRSSLSSPRAADITPAHLRWNRPDLTQPKPFSFDERDSMQRAAREQRLEDLRQVEERLQTLGARFRANPVRRYKPLVLRQSTRPLTVPRAPFSHQVE